MVHLGTDGTPQKAHLGELRGGESIKYPAPPKGKEWLYVGYYYDTEGRFILKIGTTNNLARRKAEHTRNYHKSPDFTLPKKDSFTYLWWIPLSKYNTIRYEDKTRASWQAGNIGQYIRNDRFFCSTRPAEVQVKIRKVYTVPITV